MDKLNTLVKIEAVSIRSSEDIYSFLASWVSHAMVDESLGMLTLTRTDIEGFFEEYAGYLVEKKRGAELFGHDVAFVRRLDKVITTMLSKETANVSLYWVFTT